MSLEPSNSSQSEITATVNLNWRLPGKSFILIAE